MSTGVAADNIKATAEKEPSQFRKGIIIKLEILVFLIEIWYSYFTDVSISYYISFICPMYLRTIYQSSGEEVIFTWIILPKYISIGLRSFEG